MHDGHDHYPYGREYTSKTAEQRKNAALLTYMIEHNRIHASELRQSGNKLLISGCGEAARLIIDAAHYLERCNEKLKSAADILKEEA